MNAEQTGSELRSASTFLTTHWTLVLEAARPERAGSEQAFAQLYVDYWHPLYAYIRRRGYSPVEAEDLTQDFFAFLLEKQTLAGLKREGGRFRSFLLSCLANFLAKEWARLQAKKRGGGQPLLSFNSAEEETRFLSEKVDRETPESLFEKRWAVTLLEHVMERLRRECTRDGKAALFDEVQLHLRGEPDGPPYAEIAGRHGLSEGALKVAVHRLRRRYGQLLREEVLRTVSSPEEVDEELRYLIRVLGN